MARSRDKVEYDLIDGHLEERGSGSSLAGLVATDVICAFGNELDKWYRRPRRQDGLSLFPRASNTVRTVSVSCIRFDRIIRESWDVSFASSPPDLAVMILKPQNIAVGVDARSSIFSMPAPALSGSSARPSAG